MVAMSASNGCGCAAAHLYVIHAAERRTQRTGTQHVSLHARSPDAVEALQAAATPGMSGQVAYVEEKGYGALQQHPVQLHKRSSSQQAATPPAKQPGPLFSLQQQASQMFILNRDNVSVCELKIMYYLLGWWSVLGLQQQALLNEAPDISWAG